MCTTPTLLFSCPFHAPAPTLLLPGSSFCPALLYSCPAPFKFLSRTFLAPPLFLPSSCPLSALLCSALLLPCSCTAPKSCPAHASAPLLLCSSPAPALLLVLPTPVWQPSSSSSAPLDFFCHGESRLLGSGPKGDNVL